MNVDEVKAEVPNSDILVGNMQRNGWDRVVKTRCGNFQPLTSLDTIIAEKQISPFLFLFYLSI